MNTSSTEPQFADPPWSDPLCLAERLAACPESAVTHGLYFRSAQDVARRAGSDAPGRGSYLAFGRYPTREFVEVLAGCAEAAYPDAPSRRGLFHLGRAAYHATRDSTLGRVLFAVSGRDLFGALRLVADVYERFTAGVGTAIETSADSAVIELRGVWGFPDCYHVGVFDAAMEDYGARGRIQVRSLSLADVDLKLTWS